MHLVANNLESKKKVKYIFTDKEKEVTSASSKAMLICHVARSIAQKLQLGIGRINKAICFLLDNAVTQIWSKW